MYIVLFTTMGAASSPRVVPVENVNASFRFAHVASIDLVERAESRAGKVLRGPCPLTVVRLHLAGISAAFEVLLLCRILPLCLLASRMAGLKQAADNQRNNRNCCLPNSYPREALGISSDHPVQLFQLGLARRREFCYNRVSRMQ